MNFPAELWVPIATGLGAVLAAIAVYVRNAAQALEHRNRALDSLATAAETTQALQSKQQKDLTEAWGRIRAIEGALFVKGKSE